MNTFRTLAALSLFSAAALCTQQAHAQATLDQTKALAGSVTPGDSAGFPVTISAPGSYKLMSNLYVPAGVSGIVVTADNVSIDLNGFAIIGTNICTQDSATYEVTCNMPSYNGSRGIDAGGARQLSLKNGSIQGFATVGAYLHSGVVENIRFSHNYLGMQSYGNDQPVVLTGCVANLNGYAFEVTGGTIVNTHVSHNGTAFSGSASTLITNSSATRNSRAFSGAPAVQTTMASTNKALGTVRSLGNNINNGTVY